MATRLRIQVGDSIAGQQPTDCEVILHDLETTVADVAKMVGLGDRPLAIDGALVPSPSSALAVEALASGARLSEHVEDRPLFGNPADLDSASGGVEVAVVAGVDAGAAASLAPGLHRIVPGNPSAPACYVEVVEQAQQPSRPWHEAAHEIEGVRAAAHAPVLCIGPHVTVEPSISKSLHRPPRPHTPADVAPVELQPVPPEVGRPAPLSWATMLAPVPIGIMMALFFRPIFALFALMGPIMALGRWIESRRRFRRDTRERGQAVMRIRASTDRALVDWSENMARLRWRSHPHVAELWRRARSRSVRLWERRPEHADFLYLSVGVGSDELVADVTGATPDDKVHGRVHEPLRLRAVPHALDLWANTGFGVHGSRELATAIARSVVLQLATLHGPADLEIGVLCSASNAAAWDWLKWLPHAPTSLIAHEADQLVSAFTSHAQPGGHSLPRIAPSADEPGPVTVLIVDDHQADVAAVWRRARQSGRRLRVIAVAERASFLPAQASAIMQVGRTPPLGTVGAELGLPDRPGGPISMCPIGVAPKTAESWARSLSGVIDPEATERGSASGEQPPSLMSLLGVTEVDDMVSQWEQRSAGAPPMAALGLSANRAFTIDFVNDGPHALVAGTTGSGKSELLRTMVVGLAAACSPADLNFVLVDFKGGGAFDAIDQLPHVAGLITDLDEEQIRRAIRSLGSELHRRESIFRELAASSFDEAVRASDQPLARLMVVVDEFAVLAQDYPELMASIVDLAARGRSLGMHLVLATQRPSGVVDQKIRANANLRIALRVQDSFDSHDLIGTADAASIDRKTPGQALVCVGGDAPIPLQTAFTGAPYRGEQRCSTRPLHLFPASPVDVTPDHGAPTELDVLVTLISAAAERCRLEAVPLWADPLPLELPWHELVARPASGSALALGLAESADEQQRTTWTWDPSTGPLLLVGASAGCCATGLISVGAALATTHGPDRVHLYLVDGAAGDIAALQALPHVGAYVAAGDDERIERTIALFESALATRRALGAANPQARDGAPRMVLLIDNLAAVLASQHERVAGELLDRLAALARDGASQRISLVMTARAVRDVGHRLLQQVPHRLVLELADPSGYLMLGLKARDIPTLPPMRAVDVANLATVHLVEPPDLAALASAHDQAEPVSRALLPAPVRCFPAKVSIDELDAATLVDSTLSIPVGIASESLDDATLVLGPNDHAMVVASHGMGRTTLLQLVDRQLASVGVDVYGIGIKGDATPLSTPDQVQALATSGRLAVLLVDDADLVEAPLAQEIAAIVKSRGHHVRVIAATSIAGARDVRSWTLPLRSAAAGLLIGDVAAEGDLFKVRLGPAQGLGRVRGRGYLVNRGQQVLTQFGGLHSFPTAP